MATGAGLSPQTAPQPSALPAASNDDRFAGIKTELKPPAIRAAAMTVPAADVGQTTLQSTKTLSAGSDPALRRVTMTKTLELVSQDGRSLVNKACRSQKPTDTHIRRPCQSQSRLLAPQSAAALSSRVKLSSN